MQNLQLNMDCAAQTQLRTSVNLSTAVELRTADWCRAVVANTKQATDTPTRTFDHGT